MKQYKFLNNLLGWVAFVIAAIVYILTLEPTASFWDCGEFISSAYKLEVGHPPGNPIFMLTGRFFANFASSPEQVGYMVNLMSGLLSAATIMFLFWTITHLTRRIVVKEESNALSMSQLITILGSGFVGAMVYAFSDTFWFSAVEGEVYAYSSFCTAVVFWLILKWEDVADEPHADKYIVLIAYLIGISIAVHLLNLLCIPAIVLVYYFRKYKETSLKGAIIALLVSFVLIFFLLYGLIPGFIKVTGWAELFFVNTLGLPYHTGAIFYVIAVVAAIVWAIKESYAQQSDKRIKISFWLTVTMLGVPFVGDSVLLGLALVAALGGYLYMRKDLPHRLLNTTLLCLMVIFVGYSSYALIIIRSSANTPMDQNSPDDVFTLASYLNREQYGSRPLVFGYSFVSDVERDMEGRPKSKVGSAIWRKEIKSNPNEKDKYIVTGYKEDYIYNSELDMLFPRMYSRSQSHINAYKQWSDYKGTPVRVDSSGGGSKMVNKPTFVENLRFFFNYQLNFMYWRYFMWNFSGRQNDLQGSGDVQNGNWITGISFIDNLLVGDQEFLPTVMKENKGRNVYYMLPLLLGIFGLLFQAYAGKRGIEGFWVTFFLFFMTGIAIVIYLNQTPYQPRERDYAYAGSFYAFAIWIGIGVAAIANELKRILPETPSAVVATLLCLIVPVQMIGQNWDDHDRSGRYVCRDFGMNYLSCVEPNGIIFTNGDNDTFPLWYAQETEGYRTDVRVCNLSYLQTDWYIDQMKSPAYESASLPISMTSEQYSKGRRDYAYLLDMQTEPMSLNAAMGYLLSEDRATKTIQGYNDRLDHLRTKSFYLPIDSTAVVASGTVSPNRADLMVKQIDLNYAGKSGLMKNEIAVLDMLNTNAKNGWERPMYYAVTVGSDMYMGLNDYFSLVGLAYQISPLKGDKDQMVDTEKMYDNMMHKFRWGGIDTPGVYLDETVRRMCRTQRMMFTSLITSLISEGKNEMALNALDYCMKVIPVANVPHEYPSMNLGQAYIELGEKAKGIELLCSIADNSVEFLRWYVSLTPNQMRSVSNDISLHIEVVRNVAYTFSHCDEMDIASSYIATLNQMGLGMQQ